MTAGAGAAEQARRAAERVTRLKGELAQAVEAVDRLQKQVAHAERTNRAWIAGATGEVLVADRLGLLEAQGWFILHGLHWPGRPKANLDHVLVGPGGVLVIDAKNWGGDVLLRRGELSQNGYARARESAAALQQASAIAALLEPQHRQLVQAWLCMVGQPELKATTASGVRVEGLNTIAQSVLALPTVLEREFAAAIHEYLNCLLGGDTNPTLLTTAGIGSADAGVSMLHQRRAATRRPEAATTTLNAPVGGVAGGGRGQNRGPARQAGRSRKARKRPGCLGVSARLAAIALALTLAMGILDALSQVNVTVPQPSPTISNQSESPGTG
ncbi:nuclease-related domain-containing protein [Arthrobacter sp. H20]|uniref:nuclease-related domain-containing protein n=1 Tax=Arthrobacter sp. H20 TaxID=1267981 RepID=UPI00138B17AB|nr:nuclease-related domain-containing protein [Arthrobacter sp. H20]